MAASITSKQAQGFLEEVDRHKLNARELHEIARRLLTRAGCRVVSEYRGAGDTPVAIPDLVVWHDSLDETRGSPVVVDVLARTQAAGAMLPRLRQTLHASGARTMLAISSGAFEPRVNRDEEGRHLVELSFAALIGELQKADLNTVLKSLMDSGKR
jgi:hypothetical protein